MIHKRVSSKNRKKLFDLSRREAISVLGLVVALACSTQLLLSLSQVAQASGVSNYRAVDSQDLGANVSSGMVSLDKKN